MQQNPQRCCPQSDPGWSQNLRTGKQAHWSRHGSVRWQALRLDGSRNVGRAGGQLSGLWLAGLSWDFSASLPALPICQRGRLTAEPFDRFNATLAYQRSFPIDQRSRLAKYSRKSTKRIATARRAASCFSAVTAYVLSMSCGMLPWPSSSWVIRR